MADKFLPLCYRCEHRAQFLESGRGFRCECQNPTTASYCCYGYQPMRPLLLRRAPRDKRPFGYRTVAVKLLPAETVAVIAKKRGKKRAATWARVAMSPDLDYDYALRLMQEMKRP